MRFLDFVERWLCCGRVDDDSVVSDLRIVRANPDSLAESLVAYTHDARVHHIASSEPAVVITDNVEATTVALAPTMGVSIAQGQDETSPVSEPTSLTLSMEEDVVTGQLIRFGDDIFVDVEDGALVEVPMDVQLRLGTVGDDGSEEGLIGQPAGTGVVYTTTIPEDSPSSVFRVCQDVVEVEKHRRLPHQKRGDYAACVVSEIKNRLGCPAPNAANLLAVRRMANNIMGKHGVRPTHIRSVLETVVAGVFVPDDEDLRGAKMLQSVGMAQLRNEVADAGPRSAWWDLFHPFKSRGAERVRGGV